MVFTTHIFLFYFLPLFFLVYFNLPCRWRNLWLTAASYGFYGWWEPWFVCLMAFTTTLDFGWGRIIARPRATPLERKLAVTACVVTNLSLLGFFKYYMFGAETLNRLLETFGADGFRILRVTLPIGISFYTFHSLTYIIDLYRGHATPAKSFADFAAFVALFPDLVAGPIIRYKTLAAQLAFRQHRLTTFAAGVALFILGFAKKILVANPCGQVADAVFGAAAPLAVDAWMGVLAYALQIYFDFSGYSDMAVGLGRMLGFEFPKNFDDPYRAESITEIWRRWHMSLSSVLRDYLYFPLGGNRKGETRTYVNLAVVMLLGGLWHGAKWNFVAWGAFHGGWLAWERWRGKRSVYVRWPRPARIAMTFVLMLFSWVLFRAESLGAAIDYFGAMFALAPAADASMLLGAEVYRPLPIAALAIGLGLLWHPRQAHEWSQTLEGWGPVALLVLLFGASVLMMFSQAFNPFLYFQF